MNELVYGKNSTEGIVGIEVIDDAAEIFIQDKSGQVYSEIVPNYYWLMSDTPHGDGWTRVGGSLHYKYMKLYTKGHMFFNDKKRLKEAKADVFSISDEKESLMVRDGYTYFKSLKQADVSVLSFDIESTGLEHDADAKVLIISNTLRKNGEIHKRMFCHDEYDDQGQLIKAWADWINDMDPSVIIGHNIYTFDLPYIKYIADQYDVELTIGRNGSPLKFFKYDSMKRIDGSREQAYRKVRCYGREIVDTMFLAINYDVATKKYESYGLKKIIAHEKLEKADRVFYDASQIRFNYTDPNEWSQIKAYCADDSDDALALYDLMSPAFFYLTQSVPKSFQAIVESASGSQINAMMVRSYLQQGHSLPRATFVDSFEGAISMGNPGIYRNAFKVDVASLYPSIMIHHKVYDKAKDPKGNMLTMVETFTAERLKNKKLAKETGIKYYDDMQNAQKIVINSFYGFMGAGGLSFNSPENAAFVTREGRAILTRAMAWSANRGFKLVNADTDSITFSNGEELSPDTRKSLLQDLNSLYPERIRFEDDGYYLTVVVLKAKNYVLWDGKKIKTKGSALKDAKKEKALKEFLNKIVDAIIKDTNGYVEIYNAYVKEAANVTDISRWSSKKTISSKVLKNARTNETKIRDAIEGSEYAEGDKVWMYFKPDGSLGLAEKFDGDYDKVKLFEKIYKTALTFENVIPPETFTNYKLKRNQAVLEELINEAK